MNNAFENLGRTGLNLDSFTNIEKGKKYPIGTITNGYKKVAEGKWHKVSEYGMTHIEHNDKSVTSGRQSIKYAPYSKMKEKKLADSNFHREQADKLDDKEYGDDHVENSGKYKKEKFGRPTKEDLQEYFQKHGKHLDSSTKSLIHRDEYETTVSKNQFGRLSMEIKHKEKGHTSYSGPVDEKSELYQKNKHLLGEESKKSEEAKDEIMEYLEYAKTKKHKPKVKDVIDEKGNYKEGTTDIDKNGKLTLKKGNEFTSIPSFDDMQKSHITNMFGYGDSSIKIEKTGAEIKIALESAKSKNEIAKQSSYDKIELLVGEIGTQPTEDCERYSMEGLEDKIGIMPKKYRWQEIYQDNCGEVSNGLGIGSQPTEQKPNEKKRAYNNEVDKYVDICVENLQLDTMINNISLSKKYSLTIKQASVLGF